MTKDQKTEKFSTVELQREQFSYTGRKTCSFNATCLPLFLHSLSPHSNLEPVRYNIFVILQPLNVCLSHLDCLFSSILACSGLRSVEKCLHLQKRSADIFWNSFDSRSFQDNLECLTLEMSCSSHPPLGLICCLAPLLFRLLLEWILQNMV